MQMQPTALSNTTAARATLYLAVFALLIITAGVHSGCKQHSTNQTPPPSPSPSGSPAPSSTPVPYDDTIIVIKDGSTTLDNIYSGCTGTVSGNNAKYECPGKQVDQIVITATAGPSPLPTPTICNITEQNASIKVDAGGEENDIKITNKTSQNKVVIEFRNDLYPLITPGQHRSDDNDVWLVRIKKGSACGVCRPEEKCWVTFRY
jgi:hypothetical protein